MTVLASIARLEDRLIASKSAAFLALRVMVAVQIVWTIVLLCARATGVHRHLLSGDLHPVRRRARTHSGRVRWIATRARLIMGSAFFENVIDRLGFIGPPGAPGVSWGDFPALHRLYRAGECLRAGRDHPRARSGGDASRGDVRSDDAAGASRATRIARLRAPPLHLRHSMVLSGLSEMQYAVYLLSVAAWALATVDALALSIDALAPPFAHNGTHPAH